MDLVTPQGFEQDVPGAQLLVRGARPDEHQLVADLLGRAGWTPTELDAWTPDSSTLVLYDPADGGVRGAVVVGELASGSFQLVAWVVEGVTDGSGATARLIRAAADHLRRAGGERLVVSPRGTGMVVDVLTDTGFVVMPSDPDDPTAHVILYQEL